MSFCFFFFKQKTAYEMRISDWSSDVCSSDLRAFDLMRSFVHMHVDADAKLVCVLAQLQQRRVRHRVRCVWREDRADQRLVLELKIGSASCRERGCQYV